jgi:hypothetical protein
MEGMEDINVSEYVRGCGAMACQLNGRKAGKERKAVRGEERRT